MVVAERRKPADFRKLVGWVEEGRGWKDQGDGWDI